MGLRERLQSVTQLFQSAATKGHQLREDEERGESPAPSAGTEGDRRDEPRQDAMTAEDREKEQTSQQQERDRQV